ncbi:MAG: 7-carboxy-7-deazaguanine synthase QueE [Gammaproteobacteria bacterium]|nr:7-carboxy-7-deazaguanine synthase QueE [Gammaproteobacteria bacterium]
MSLSNRLRITEIFFSLQGESVSSGLPTVFVRLTGCPLRCQYCDTAYAFQGGEWLTFSEIIKKVTDFGAAYVCVTGGEPLAQKKCKELLSLLCEQGLNVSLETSGAIPIDGIDPRVSRVMDLKTPGSGEESKNLFGNIELLTEHDQLKFVLCSREDYDWAKMILNEHDLFGRMEILFSVSFGQLRAQDLVNWILEDNLIVRFQMQLHKLLWDDEPGR